MLLVNKIMITLGVLFLIGTTYLIESGIAIVDIDTPEVRLWIPVPIALGHWACDLANVAIERQRGWDKVMQYRIEIAEILRQIKELPDADLVEVQNPREQVRIYKRADALYVSVDSTKEKVLVRLPTQAVDNLVKAFSSPRISAGDLFACLEWQSGGDLIKVQNGKERIRISLL